MDQRQRGPTRSVLLFVKAVFSETALRIFLIFCMKLGDYKGRNVTSCRKVTSWKKGDIVHQIHRRTNYTTANPPNTEIVDEGDRNIIQKSIATWAGKMHKKMFLHTRFMR